MIDYKALAKRLEMHAECHANVEPYDDEQRQWADDLRTVVSLLEEMAEAKPVAWMHDGPPLHGEASITPEPDAWHEFSLYAHPAPQPQPTVSFDDARVQRVYDILCSETIPPEGEHWEGFAARRIVDALSEPTDRCKHGVRFPHECKACADEPSKEEIQRWLEAELKSASEPTGAHDLITYGIAVTLGGERVDPKSIYRDEPNDAQSQAAIDVLAERRRQIKAEGWSPEHDDEHANGGLALAAACYALSSAGIKGDDPAQLRFWPWDDDWWKPSDRRRDLVKAGALILAEIERLDRAALAAKESK